jgi:purine-nucleoside phosphorylase
MTEAVEQAMEIINSRGVLSVDLGIVLGEGLGGVADGLEDAIVIPYADLPGFPEGLSDPDGVLVVAEIEGVKVAHMRGRAEFHRNADAAAMAIPIETLAMLGMQNLIVTAGVGSVRADMHPSNLVLITDHINFGGINPLIGLSADGGLVGLTDAYDPKMFRRLKRATLHCGVQTHEGVMMWFSGPTYETPAEIKMSRILGADVVTMSMVPEVILARRLGINVAAVGAVTYYGAGFSGGAPSSSTTLKQAQAAAIGMRRLLRAFPKTREIGGP